MTNKYEEFESIYDDPGTVTYCLVVGNAGRVVVTIRGAVSTLHPNAKTIASFMGYQINRRLSESVESGKFIVGAGSAPRGDIPRAARSSKPFSSDGRKGRGSARSDTSPRRKPVAKKKGGKKGC